VLTAARDAAERAAQIAAEAVLSKPFQLADLLSLVGQYAAPQ
jgi:CheY-like chemotaxis protein